MADYCATEGIWLHVDAAYGRFAVLTEKGKGLLGGIERADAGMVEEDLEEINRNVLAGFFGTTWPLYLRQVWEESFSSGSVSSTTIRLGMMYARLWKQSSDSAEKP